MSSATDLYRIASNPEWLLLVSTLENAEPRTLTRCLDVVRKRCATRLGGTRFAHLVDAKSVSADRAIVAEAAEATDGEYLDTLDSNGGIADANVLERFGTARVLAAWLWTFNEDMRRAVLEALYELSVISETEREALHKDVTAALSEERS
jgi:hypothetical protein